MKTKLSYRYPFLIIGFAFLYLTLNQFGYSYQTGIVKSSWSQYMFLDIRKEYQIIVTTLDNQQYTINERRLSPFSNFKTGNKVLFAIKSTSPNSYVAFLDQRINYLVSTITLFGLFALTFIRRKK